MHITCILRILWNLDWFNLKSQNTRSLTRYSVEGLRCDVVVKASSSKPLERMFLGEALGLRALRDSGHLAIPEATMLSATSEFTRNSSALLTRV